MKNESKLFLLILLVILNQFVLFIVISKAENNISDSVGKGYYLVQQDLKIIDKHHNSYLKCLNDIDRDKIEDITMLEVSKVDTCFINGVYTSPCFVGFDYWSDNSTSISVNEVEVI